MIYFISYFNKQRKYAFIVLITYALPINFNVKLKVKLLGQWSKLKKKRNYLMISMNKDIGPLIH